MALSLILHARGHSQMTFPTELSPMNLQNIRPAVCGHKMWHCCSSELSKQPLSNRQGCIFQATQKVPESTVLGLHAVDIIVDKVSHDGIFQISVTKSYD